jgi:uncharacterized coiled-coil protein SlyX
MAIENITGNETLEELQALLEAMEKRLSILDEKKGLTRPEIYAKVRSEYEAKIAEIQGLMLEKGADLEEAMNQAVVDQDTLGFRKQELKDILDEMELRLVIGEIDDETKARQTQEHQEEMAEIDEKLSALAQKIANFQKMMAAKPKAAPIAEPPKPAPIPKPSAPAPKPAFRAQPEPEAVQQDVRQDRPEPKPAPKPVQMPPKQPVKPPEPMPAAPPAAPEPAVNEIDELEKQFASLLGESLAEQPQAKPAEVPVPEAEEIAPAPAAEEPAEDSHDGELKCPKCGSFNRADNWYCEKCGNELISAQDLLGK